jgi:hypothetical protein
MASLSYVIPHLVITGFFITSNLNSCKRLEGKGESGQQVVDKEKEEGRDIWTKVSYVKGQQSSAGNFSTSA